MSIIELNDKAIEQMRKSQYADALSTLKMTLKDLKRRLEQVSAENSEQDTEEDDQQQDRCQVVVEPVDMQVSSSSNVEDKTCSTVYDRALALIGSEPDIASNKNFRERSSAVVLFNMALIHHLAGLKGSKQDVNYRNALRLYSMAGRVLSSSAESSVAAGTSDYLINLAITNNQAHIHSCHFSRREAQQCHARMCSILGRLPLTLTSSNDVSAARLQDDVHHFRLNVMLVRNQNFAPAA